MEARNLILLVLLLRVGPALSQSLHYPAESAGIGGAGIALDSRLNPALHSESTIEMGLTRLFGLCDLDVGRIGLSRGRARIDAAYLGLDGYQATEFRLSVALGAGIGVRATGLRRHIGAYPPALTGSLDIGLARSLNVIWRVGAVLERVFSPGHRTLAVGVAATPIPSLTILAEAAREGRFPTIWRLGLVWMASSTIRLRAGSTRNPTRLSGGLGLAIGSIRVDFARDRHEVLGWTTSTQVVWVF